ncbi:hypothetical protein PTSG_04842 [Salpingoeca rosetta]|uniref:Uncharacterized protein n=1 Tax=Salpingoeca rosetta (strain ATCC 50818 / BSB-021) TaxID=946362 RepID=F2U9V2_SALR5|nr:uncharacterized protein PTSG_04842 [Salpingoeca rosetta]EGD73129.1 hypothetical protein PTSG_04842 [Salpingoeca rosetta]|eukprot:XP_004994160.1 hypothetical protein PTSG_04842 [Salpingoeca rosetta]
MMALRMAGQHVVGRRGCACAFAHGCSIASGTHARSFSRSTSGSSASLVSWGASDGLGLGVGRSAADYPLYLPYFVDVGANKLPTKVAVGTNHAAAIIQDAIDATSSPQLFMTGLNTQRQLGSTTNDQMLTTFKASALPDDAVPRDVDCGRCHSVVVSDAGVFATGLNSLGQCGAGASLRTLPTWQRVYDGDVDDVVSVTCGLDHTLLLLKDGTVLVSGWTADGQTGLPGMTANAHTFTRIPGLEGVISVSAGADTTLFLTQALDDGAYTWGTGALGSHGHADNNHHPHAIVSTPTRLVCGRVLGAACGSEASILIVTPEGSQ